MNNKAFKLGAFAIVASIVAISACKKDAKQVVNCLSETAFSSIHTTVDAGNSKKYTFHVSYDGSGTLGTVNWNFGDGQQATTTGTAEVQHIFTDGTYTVKAEPNISISGGSCKPSLKKTVEVK
jgi:hypothetical protein